MKVEVWKDINGFSNYQISNYGRVKSKSRYVNVGIKNVNKFYKQEKIINQYSNGRGYMQVTIYNDIGKPKTIKVHRLVARAFIENKNNLPQVNHKDGNKLNNSVDNLEWCDNLYNIRHGIENGLVDLKLRVENMRKLGKSKIGAEARWHLK